MAKSKFIKHSKCCTDSGNGTTEPKDCREKWEKEYKIVCNDYNKLAAVTSLNKVAYVNSLGWKDKLKNWYELVDKTDEKAKAIVTELDFLLEQVNGVCNKSDCTSEAIGKLACLVKSIFDCLYTYDDTSVGLKDKIIEFRNAVECLTTVSDEEKEEVYKCLEDYEKKIILVCDLQDAILSKLIETLKCAKLLYAAICKEGGLKDKLKGIKEDFNGTTPEEEHEHCHPEDEESSSTKKKVKEVKEVKYPCDDKEAKPVPVFPISEGDYYNDLAGDLETATEETENLKVKWIDAKKLSDKKLSQKNSLAEAIEAAKAAESGK